MITKHCKLLCIIIIASLFSIILINQCKEGFNNPSDYNPSTSNTSCNLYNRHEQYKKNIVPPFPELSMFVKNNQSYTCCPSAYSGSNGCVCMSKEQLNYLNNRGGNRGYTEDEPNPHPEF